MKNLDIKFKKKKKNPLKSLRDAAQLHTQPSDNMAKEHIKTYATLTILIMMSRLLCSGM